MLYAIAMGQIITISNHLMVPGTGCKREKELPLSLPSFPFSLLPLPSLPILSLIFFHFPLCSFPVQGATLPRDLAKESGGVLWAPPVGAGEARLTTVSCASRVENEFKRRSPWQRIYTDWEPQWPCDILHGAYQKRSGGVVSSQPNKCWYSMDSIWQV